MLWFVSDLDNYHNTFHVHLTYVDRNEELYPPSLMMARPNIIGAVMVYVVASQRVLGTVVGLVMIRGVIVSKWPYCP